MPEPHPRIAIELFMAPATSWISCHVSRSNDSAIIVAFSAPLEGDVTFGARVISL